jgi:hypothetical protein
MKPVTMKPGTTEREATGGSHGELKEILQNRTGGLATVRSVEDRTYEFAKLDRCYHIVGESVNMKRANRETCEHWTCQRQSARLRNNLSRKLSPRHRHSRAGAGER